VLGAAISLRLAMPVAARWRWSAFSPCSTATRTGWRWPETASGLLYGLGFVTATALLHGLGIGIGLAVGRLEGTVGRSLVRVAGSVAAIIGVALLAGVA